jgi:hypothetical protein
MLNRATQGMLAAVMAFGLAACAKDKIDDMGSASAAPSSTAGMDGAEYTLVFRNNWTPANHPFEYPSANPVSGPHYSGIIGAAHNASFSLFTQGAMPTPGLEKLSEEGKPAPLDEEIRVAVGSGTAANLFTTGPLRDLKDSIVATVRVDGAHPMVSFVAMIAPSPDWFTGAANVNLKENGQWLASRTIQLYAWDSGGDDGVTYKAADQDNAPKKPTMQATSRHFVTNGAAIPVATVTLVRK